MPRTMPTLAKTTGTMTVVSGKLEESPDTLSKIVACVTILFLVPCIPGLTEIPDVVRLSGFEVVADSGKSEESPGAVSKVVACVTM